MKGDVREWARPESKLEEVRQLAFRSIEGTSAEMIGKFFKHAENIENDFRIKEGLNAANFNIEPIIIPLIDELDDSDSDESVFDGLEPDD